jgi:hypothetical protein
MADVDHRYTAVLGPIKMEVIDLSDVDDADTVASILARPTHAVAISMVDDNNTIGVVQVGVSGKTLTLNNSNLSASDLLVLVFGF